MIKSLSSLSSPSDNQQLLKRFETGFGRLVLPEITTQEALSDFINDDSMLMFYMLKISNSFLDKPEEKWKQDDAYLKRQRNCK